MSILFGVAACACATAGLVFAVKGMDLWCIPCAVGTVGFLLLMFS